MNREIHNVGIVGGGTMGTGIALACLKAGMKVLIAEKNQEQITKAKQTIENQVAQFAQKGRLVNLKVETNLDEFLAFTEVAGLLGSDLIVEAAIENYEAKNQIFNELQNYKGILTSNTSSLSITQLGKGLVNCQTFAGLHFFNPAHVLPLVEIVKADFTNDNVVAQLVLFVKAIGKTPVVTKDTPGFIVNRVARSYYLESLYLAENAAVGIEKMDEAMEGIGFKLGPFKLMDLIGNDVNFAVSESVYKGLGSPKRFEPSAMQNAKNQEGKFGKKSGEGFYKYS